MRAPTLHAEWAWAIAHLDKRYENRSWPIPGGEWFALHAGKHIGGRPGVVAKIEGVEAVCGMARPAGWFIHGNARTAEFVRVSDALTVAWNIDDVPTSAITGLFRVNRHYTGGRDPWSVPGQIANGFDYRPLPAPIPCKGAQGLWTVPAEIAARIGVPRG